MERPAIVVFGAAVWADGRPSTALARRIGYAAHAARESPVAPILCSGAAGRTGPSEASVMAQVLTEFHGIEGARLTLDEESCDTLESAVAAARFVRTERLTGCIVCSDRYHLRRIRLLLAALGTPSRPGPVPPGRGGASLAHWTRMSLREALATPYDAAIVLARRRTLMAAVEAQRPG